MGIFYISCYMLPYHFPFGVSVVTDDTQTEFCVYENTSTSIIFLYVKENYNKLCIDNKEHFFFIWFFCKLDNLCESPALPLHTLSHQNPMRISRLLLQFKHCIN